MTLEDDDAHEAQQDIPHKGKKVDPGSMPPSDGTADKAQSEPTRDPTRDAILQEMDEARHDFESGLIDGNELRDRLESRISARLLKKARHISEVSLDALALMDDRAEGREKPIATPWPDFNDQLPGGGYWSGCHLLVSGTGARKTTAALQIALQYALTGGPVLYAGLELEDEQGFLRLAGQLARVPWSKLMTGEATAAERKAVHAVRAQLEGLPIHFEPDEPTGWCVSRMHRAASEMRALYPSRPLLFIVDFLQLIADESDGRRELRERIGRAAYAARHLAKRERVTVLLVSSIAREAYAKVTGVESLLAAGLDGDTKGSTVVERFLRAPDVIVGLGKESGEIEFSADTVTVAITLPRVPKDENTTVVFALAKVRAGKTGWCSLLTDGHQFLPDPKHGAAVLEAIEKERAGKKKNQTSNGNGRGHAVDVPFSPGRSR